MNGHRVVFVIDGSEGWIETVRDGGVFVIDGTEPEDGSMEIETVRNGCVLEKGEIVFVLKFL